MRLFLILAALFFGLLLSTGAQAQSVLGPASLAWSPDGTLLTVGTSGGMRVYRVETADLLWHATTDQPVEIVRINPLGTLLAAGLGSGSGTGPGTGDVVVWNASSGEQVARFPANRVAVRALAFSPDGQQMVTGGGYFPSRADGDYALRFWDTSDWSELPDLMAHGVGDIRSVTFSTGGRYTVFSSAQGPVDILDRATNSTVASIHQPGAGCLLMDEDAGKLIVGFYSAVQVWVVRAQPEFHLVRRASWLTEYTTNPNEVLQGERVIGCGLERFATASEDGTLRIRDVETAQIETAYHHAGRHFFQAHFSPDGARLALIGSPAPSPSSEVGAADYSVAIWTLGADEMIELDLD